MSELKTLDRARACPTKVVGIVRHAVSTCRFQVLSDAQWPLIAELLPRPTGRHGRPFSDACVMVEGIVYRYRWDRLASSVGGVPPVADGVDLAPAHGRRRDLGKVRARLTAAADAAGLVDWSLSVDSTIACAHRHATNTTRLTECWIESREPGNRAA